MKMRTVAIALAISMGMTTLAAAAPSYSDVPANHWAYTSISKLAEQGVIVGDSTGKYNPNQVLDKFMASKMLAQIAGYKYVNLTEQERLAIDRAYAAKQNILKQYRDKFTKWDSGSDKEIAFLLEKGIYSELEDLGQFVVKLENGTERVRNLSKEEAAVFLVRLMNKNQEALSLTVASADLFADDAAITAKYKPYVYYLKSVGIIQGGSSSKFNPKDEVTKAVMAVLLDKTMMVMNGQNPNAPATQTPIVPTTPTVPTNSSGAGNTQTGKVESLEGVFDKAFTTLNVIQITEKSGTKTLWRLATDVKVYIDGISKSYTDLQEGMPLTILLKNSEAAEIKANSIAQQNNNNNSNNSNNNNSNNNNTNNSSYNSQIEKSTLEGIVAKLEANTLSIGIEISMLSPRGEIQKEVRTYTLDTNYSITRGGKEVSFSNINVGDIVKAQVGGSRAYKIELMERYQTFTGKLVERKYAVNGSPILVIEDEKGKKTEYQVTNSTSVSRKGSSRVSWSDLRIGDKVEVDAEYDKLLSIYGEGTRTAEEGTIEEVLISKNPRVTVRLEDGRIKTYGMLANVNIDGNGTDLYALRLGYKVRLRLDSEEIESIVITQTAGTYTLTGYIDTLRVSSNYMTIRERQNYYGDSMTQIYVNENTIIVDSRTGNRLTFGDLRVDMELFIVLDGNSSTKRAQSITVLSR